MSSFTTAQLHPNALYGTGGNSAGKNRVE